MAVAFARMANDLFLTAWDPEMEYGIFTLERQLQNFVQEEELLDTLEARGPSDDDLAKMVASIVVRSSSLLLTVPSQ